MMKRLKHSMTNKKLQIHTYKLPLLFLLPAGLIFAFCVIYPMMQTGYISFFEWNGITSQTTMKFVGLENFIEVLKNKFFWTSLKNNLYILIVGGICAIGSALFFSTVLHKGIRGAKFFRVVYFFPNIMAGVSVGIIWMFIYSPVIGILNNLLDKIGLQSITHSWLAEPIFMVPAITVPIIWQATGFFLVILLGGLQNLPTEVFDAAKIDGANAFQEFKFVTFPMLRPIITILSVYWFISSMRIFELNWVMLKYAGSKSMVTEQDVLATTMYIEAFQQYRLGYASAFAVMIFFIIIIGSGIFYLFRRKGDIKN